MEIKELELDSMDLPNESKFLFVGNNVSIDFVNTLIADNDGPVELLSTLADLIEWAARVRLFESDQADRILEAWGPNQVRILGEARKLRTMLHELFSDVIAGLGVNDLAISTLNERLRDLQGYSQLVRSESGFKKLYSAELQVPKHLLAPIAASAADLLCYGDLRLIKKCENASCVLLFYDTTKNHSRRWCSMADCGNRAKASAFYKRKRERTK